MDLIELEKLAMRGMPMPENLTLYQQMFFQCMENLYARYKRKYISKEKAIQEKRAVYRKTKEYKRLFDLYSRSIKETARFWKEIELQGSRYAKNKTIQNADSFYDAVYGFSRGVGHEEQENEP